MPTGFDVHPQLARDSVEIGDLPLSRLLLMRDANYPWLILVPRKAGVTELIDLEGAEQQQLMTEIDRCCRALRALTRCHKLNVAALGNAVAQLHVHVIARFRDDPAWPKPVWGVVPPRAYAADGLEQFRSELRAAVLSAGSAG